MIRNNFTHVVGQLDRTCGTQSVRPASFKTRLSLLLEHGHRDPEPLNPILSRSTYQNRAGGDIGYNRALGDPLRSAGTESGIRGLLARSMPAIDDAGTESLRVRNICASPRVPG